MALAEREVIGIVRGGDFYCTGAELATDPLIEDNWNLGRIGNASTDAVAGSLLGMFDFDGPARRLILDPATGMEVSGK